MEIDVVNLDIANCDIQNKLSGTKGLALWLNGFWITRTL